MRPGIVSTSCIVPPLHPVMAGRLAPWPARASCTAARLCVAVRPAWYRVTHGRCRPLPLRPALPVVLADLPLGPPARAVGRGRASPMACSALELNNFDQARTTASTPSAARSAPSLRTAVLVRDEVRRARLRCVLRRAGRAATSTPSRTSTDPTIVEGALVDAGLDRRPARPRPSTILATWAAGAARARGARRRRRSVRRADDPARRRDGSGDLRAGASASRRSTTRRRSSCGATSRGWCATRTSTS